MSSEFFQERLEDIAREYHVGDSLDDKYFDHLFHILIADKINSLVEPNMRILELGYGEGTVSGKLLQLKGSQRTIIEGSDVLAQKAIKELGPDVKVVHSLFEEYDEPDSYDLVIATNVLEHVGDPKAVLERIRGWLRIGGTCVITVPNSESFHRVLAQKAGLIGSTKQLSARDKAVGHLRVYDLGVLTAEIISSDLEIVRTEGMVLKFLDNASQLALPESVIRALHQLNHVYDPEVYANLYVEARK